MQQQVNNIEKKVDEQGELLNKIYSKIVGDEFNDGMIDDVKKNTAHRNNSIKTSGFIAGVSIVLGSLLGKFWDKVIHIF